MRMRVQKWLAGLCATFVSIAGIGAASGGTMQWSELLDRPRPKADIRIAYGPDALACPFTRSRV